MAANYLNAHLLYLDYLNAEEAEGERVINRINDFENMMQEKFLERYSLPKSVLEKVHSEIEYRLVHVRNRNLPLSSMQQLLIALKQQTTETDHKQLIIDERKREMAASKSINNVTIIFRQRSGIRILVTAP